MSLMLAIVCRFCCLCHVKMQQLQRISHVMISQQDVAADKLLALTVIIAAAGVARGCINIKASVKRVL